MMGSVEVIGANLLKVCIIMAVIMIVIIIVVIGSHADYYDSVC